MIQEPFPAEPSNMEPPDSETIAAVTARLLRWGRVAPAGLARVEYVSARAQEGVLERLRREFQGQNIPFHEIELTPDTPAIQHVARLQETFRDLPPGVVSITGLNRAFPADVPLLDSLGILNFYRDTLVHLDLRQIWWMQGEMGNTFRLYNPDFDRFFLVRLHLTEIPAITETPNVQFSLPEGDLLTRQEAEQAALYNLERFYKGLRARRELSELMSLCVSVFKPLFQAGQIVEAGKRQEQLFAEMEGAGYDLRTYLEAEPDLVTAQLRDAENFNVLSYLRWHQGRYAEAQAFVECKLAIERRLLPQNHPDIAASLSNLAVQYSSQGHYSKSETLYKEALEIRQKALSEEHPDIALSLNNLAQLYQARGRYDEAEPLMKEALAIDRKALPKNHPTIAISVGNLAGLYEARGRYDEAEPLYLEALAISRKALPEGHPDIATSLNSLAGLYQARGRYDEAEPLMKEALAIYRKSLPEGHPTIAISVGNLAQLYKTRGRYEEAEPLMKEALAIHRKALPEGHPTIATSVGSIAGLYEARGRYDEAEILYLEALAISRKSLPEGHPDIATSVGNLAQLYKTRGRYDEAEILYLEALAIDRKALPKNHPNIASSLNNLALSYEAQGRYPEAEMLYREGLEILERTLGLEHPNTEITRNNLGMFLFMRQQNQKLYNIPKRE